MCTQNITGKAFSDQTGKFICPSTAGNNYVFILYDYDSNTIHARAIPTRTKNQLLTAYSSIVKDLTARGFKPRLQKLDNEISDDMENFMIQQDIDFQLTPAGLHRRNLAERAIQTFKNHFISGLCSTHPDFPLVLWDKLLNQCLITLNLLRQSRVNPQLSAYAQLYGPFDYSKTPIAPPGMKVLIHERPDDRGSYDPHGISGWYIGPSMKHYRCHRVWVTSTCSERISDTVTWIPHGISMPTSSTTDIIIAAANDLTKALKQSVQAPSPLPTETTKALETLTTIFRNHSTKNSPSPAPPNAAEVPRVITPSSPPSTGVPRVITPPVTSPVTPHREVPDPRPRPLSQKSAPTITSEYFNISTINKNKRKINKKNKTRIRKNTPNSPSLPHRRSPRLHKSTQNPEFANAVLDDTTGKLLEYRDLLKGPD
jgi:hypothetical protein